jgi:hypothetical protein
MRALLLSLLALTGGPAAPLLRADPVRFGREVLPILSAKCFACHGPDAHERKAGLRLDTREGALEGGDEGPAVVPGQPEASRLLTRIHARDPQEVMPPPDTHKAVSPAEAEVLRRWIAEGAPWGRHWSFEPIVRPTPPGPGEPIDAFVGAALAAAGLTPAPRADPHTLARRLALDLTGLPPTLAQAETLAADPSPARFAALVEELLASPAFGEHWARHWLDIARYADTKGYEKDLGRTMWPYRDWVVDAFNRDLPLDRFTEEQLAGDLLPDGDLAATAFHRNTLSNDEGGTDDEEFRTVAVKDRVDTTGQAWMGLTLGCAKCHTHKYDPITLEEYYAFYALFNQTEDADRPDDAPTHPVLTAARAAERTGLESDRREAEAALRAAVDAAARAPDDPWRVLAVTSARSHKGATLTVEADGAVRATGKHPDRDVAELQVALPAGRHTAFRLEALTAPLADGRLTVGRSAKDPNFVVSEFTVEREGQAVPLADARAGFAQDNWPAAGAIDGKPETGWAVSPRKEEPHAVVFTAAPALESATNGVLRVVIHQNYGHGLLLQRFRLASTDADPARVPLTTESPETQAARARLAQAEQALKRFDAATPRLPILRELPESRRRVTRVHLRGSFLDPGPEVMPGVPTAFGALPPGAPTNRLGVAKWLMSPEHPLTARVWANRIWARLLGTGLVETEEDFGALGSPPSHPELLDWLAVEYREGGWSLKHLLRVIVRSETYRRASAAPPALRAADPQNRLLARAARPRLAAETVRDQALAVAGLLSSKRGGPPVMPPQPAGLWRSTYSGQQWIDAEGEDRWRRGLYTYLKRTTPHPALIAFDAGSREICLLRRQNTNTPLQALVTLNDPALLEAAAALAARLLAEPAADDAARAIAGLRRVLIRPVARVEADPVVRLVRDARAHFTADPAAAAALLAACRWPAPAGIPDPEGAAWLLAASALLNLDETLTRP